MEYRSHKSILLSECEQYLFESRDEKKDLRYLDITLGGGGHFRSFVDKFDISYAVGLDQDTDALKANNDLLDLTKSQVRLIHTNFNDFYKDYSSEYEGYFDAILGDLGVSSHHFDCPERGFSFRFDADLDMRMDTVGNDLTAAEILATYTKEELLKVITDYGEEKFAYRIVERIIEKRSQEPLLRTKQLEEICYLSYPKAMRYKKAHPATKTFQALRIEVNKELEVLENSLPKLFSCLRPGGRLGIITFHSMEDRIVKRGFKAIHTEDKYLSSILTKRPLAPSVLEIENNPRSRSAKLRVIQKNKIDPNVKRKLY